MRDSVSEPRSGRVLSYSARGKVPQIVRPTLINIDIEFRLLRGTFQPDEF